MNLIKHLLAAGQLLEGVQNSANPFVWQKPDGFKVATAKSGGLEGLQNSLDTMEEAAKTDPDVRQSLEFHKKRGDFIQHALKEIDRVPDKNQFAEHTKTFITTLQGLSQTAVADPGKAHEVFRQVLNNEVFNLLDDIRPYQIFRNTTYPNFDSELDQQETMSQEIMAKHFTQTGAVVASFSPAYYLDWGRDGGIVSDAVISEKPLDPSQEALLDSQLKYDEMFRKNSPGYPGGLGEARTDVNGNIPPGPWGSPQFDAAALKAMAFSKYGMALIQKGDSLKASSSVYPAVHDYLEYLIRNDGNPCWDPWEEIKANKHFWTETAKAVAFKRGSELADALGQKQDAAKYQQWSDRIVQNSLQQIFFQDMGDKIIFPAYQVLNPGSAGKYSILDSQVLGALLLGKEIGYPVSLDNPYALHTFSSILDAFKNLYPINKNSGDAVGVGRYPDDRYAGPDAMGKGGNPWIISTLWAGRYFYELATKYVKEGQINLSDGRKDDLQKLLGISLPCASTVSQGDQNFKFIVDRLIQRGDAQLKWVLDHAQQGGNFSEQIDRNSGSPCSVLDLAWSHAAFLETMQSRRELAETFAASSQHQPLPIAA